MRRVSLMLSTFFTSPSNVTLVVGTPRNDLGCIDLRGLWLVWSRL